MSSVLTPTAPGRPFTPPVDLPPPEPARISVQQYHAMGEAGILTTEDRVELIEGVLVGKPMQGPTHVEVVEELYEACRSRCPNDGYVRQEKPVTLAESEPEPDIAVAKGRRQDYRGRHPSGGDCLLVIEVSDSTLGRDLFKADAYASGGVPQYWIVDLAGGRLIVHSEPTADGYRSVVEADAAEVALPGGPLRVAVADLLAD